MGLSIYKVRGQKFPDESCMTTRLTPTPVFRLSHYNNNMTRTSKGRLSDFEKGQIVALAEKNCSLSEIQAQVNRSKSTIYEFLQRFRERGSEENLPTFGRPLKLSTSTRRLLVRQSKKDRQQPL